MAKKKKEDLDKLWKLMRVDMLPLPQKAAAIKLVEGLRECLEAPDKPAIIELFHTMAFLMVLGDCQALGVALCTAGMTIKMEWEEETRARMAQMDKED